MDYNKIEWNDKVDITKEQWKNILVDERLVKPYNLDLILMVYNEPNHMATATDIAIKNGQSPKSYNSNVGQLGKRIAKYLGIEAPRQKHDSTKFNYWHIMFLGARHKNGKNFLWILRPELKEAIDELIIEKRLSILDTMDEYVKMPYEINKQQEESLFEGAMKKITVNAYERNPKARKLCLEKYGYKCCVCEFDFEKVYGDIGFQYIEVHHLRPLHEINKEYQIDPVNDLRPVCPNCHAMLHKASLTIEELRNRIKGLKTLCAVEQCEKAEALPPRRD
ncbi:HNH endonuclease [Desulforamulus profundi]|uniref:HNH endonuclease n=1 Tax=Desulforamulus profundi TaxID=1383067 RepID=A0A2C6MEA8_9FIRM|nr:HNH endonuclease [Desulforamulus profundi]PHJ37693.1 HNH endonuclease [Desulforamulus profundi]